MDVSFYFWTVIGAAVGILSQWIAPAKLRGSTILDLSVGIVGAWTGALLAGAILERWDWFGVWSVVGAVLGAAGAVLATGAVFIAPQGEREERLRV